MNFQVITLLPDWVETIKQFGVVGRAFDKNLATLSVINPREFTTDRHHTVDDRPYGGGPGMVMKAQPLLDSLDKAASLNASIATPHPKSLVIYVSPQGRPLTQDIVQDLSQLDSLTIIAGRYEGVDERLIESHVDLEISLGDFVLSGGELPAMMLIDAIVRLHPDALGHRDSATQDSFSQSTDADIHHPMLDHPHYTRPDNWHQKPIPEVLSSGDHAKIAAWRREIAHQRTWQRRPEQVKSRAD